MSAGRRGRNALEALLRSYQALDGSGAASDARRILRRSRRFEA
jgi:hypothetical protein